MRFSEGASGEADMTKSSIFVLVAMTFLATAGSAQTTPPAQPDKQNSCADTGTHNNMLPAIRPGEKPKSCDGKVSNTPSPSSANQGDATQPDQGKPGTQTRPSDNTTTMHTPGSENSQDQGPSGAPKA
jgi:hypothetical protein